MKLDLATLKWVLEQSTNINKWDLRQILFEEIEKIENSELNLPERVETVSKLNLRERVEAGLDRELKRQKSAGKKFLSDAEIDSLVDSIIKEELGESYKEKY